MAARYGLACDDSNFWKDKFVGINAIEFVNS
jgi:hypothetical protein